MRTIVMQHGKVVLKPQFKNYGGWIRKRYSALNVAYVCIRKGFNYPIGDCNVEYTGENGTPEQTVTITLPVFG